MTGELVYRRLLYLALTSRLLPRQTATERIVSVAGKGPSSSGKSFTIDQAAKFFPGTAIIDLVGGMSAKFLQYDQRDYRHALIYVGEYALIEDDKAVLAALRTLLTEHRLVYGTVDRGDNNNEALSGRLQATPIEILSQLRTQPPSLLRRQPLNHTRQTKIEWLDDRGLLARPRSEVEELWADAHSSVSGSAKLPDSGVTFSKRCGLPRVTPVAGRNASRCGAPRAVFLSGVVGAPQKSSIYEESCLNG